MTQPKVSVVMCVFNGGTHLPEAVDSILEQTFSDFQFIIVDDASTDNTPAMLDRYTDPRIRRIHNPSNLGAGIGRNRGLQMATGEYIAIMDADDVSLPFRLERQFSFLERHPSVGMVGSSVRVVNETNEPLGEWLNPTDPTLIDWTLLFYNPICHPTAMYRRSIIQTLAGYALSFPYAEDYDLWVRMRRVTSLAQLPEILLNYRLHAGQITSKHFDIQEQSAAEIIRRNLNSLCPPSILPDEVIFAIRQLLGVYPEGTRPVYPQAVRLLRDIFAAYSRDRKLKPEDRCKIQAHIDQALLSFGKQQKNVACASAQNWDRKTQTLIKAWSTGLFDKIRRRLR